MCTVDVTDKPKAIPSLKPGQMWRWTADYMLNDRIRGWWPLTRISNNHLNPGIRAIENGHIFMLVSLDGEGPWYDTVTFDVETGQIKDPKRYHVVLLGDALYWFQHAWFETSELIQDVE